MSEVRTELLPSTDPALLATFGYVMPPDDPYNQTRIQFDALKSLGFPARLAPVEPQDVMAELAYKFWAEAYGGLSFDQADMLRPVVTRPEFAGCIVPCADCVFIDYDASLPAASGHPINWIGAVADGNVDSFAGRLGMYNRTGDAGDIKLYGQWDIGIVLKGCMVAAYRRYEESRDRPGLNFARCSGDAGEISRNLIDAGCTPIAPSKLIELAQDYYQLVVDSEIPDRPGNLSSFLARDRV